MSQTTITDAFNDWLARRIADNKPGRPDKMVFAYITGQDPLAPVNPAEGMPAPADIRHVADITRFGTLNENAFVTSVLLDTTLGNWSYNWIGLVDEETNTVLMIVHLPEQRKLKSQGSRQGNTLTRNLVMEFTGAAAASQITVTPETWQIDFSARLRSMDESRRLARVDHYGEAAFDGGSFRVSLAGSTVTVAPGLGYVAGLRVQLDNPVTLALAGNTGVWVDAVWSGSATGSWAYGFSLRTASALTDYTDAAGYPHYVTRIAEIKGGTVTDHRIPFPLQRLEKVLDGRYLHVLNNLKEIADNGTSEQKKARENIGVLDASTTRKGLARLTSLIRKEDEDSEELALTPRALKKVTDAIAPLMVPVGGAMLWFSPVPPDGWLEGNGQAFDGKANPKLLAVYPSGRVPDCRGYGLRGWDHGAGVDPDSMRHIGSYQEDAQQKITGSFPADTREANGAGVSTTGAFTERRISKGSGEDGSNRGRLFIFDSSRVVRTSTETRGKNIACMVIFKTDKVEADEGEPAPTGVIVTPATTAVNAGTTQQFVASVLPASVAGKYPVTWSVSDASLGSITQDGRYTATGGKVGQQTVIASITTGLNGVATVTQCKFATGLSIAPLPDIQAGESADAVISFLPVTADEPLLYSSSNADVVTFFNGQVTGLAAGNAIITVRGQYSGVTGSRAVTITPADVPDEFLRITGNLAEIAAAGAAAQAEAQANLGIVLPVGKLGAIGSYAWMTNASTTNSLSPGTLMPGISLKYAGSVVSYGNPVPPGTWMCMGAASNANEKTLFQRIA